MGVEQRFDEALPHFDRVIALDSLFADAYLYRGMALLELQENKQAYADFQSALRLDPGNAGEIHYFLGLSQSAMENFPKAIHYFSKATEIAPEYYHFFQRGKASLYLCHYQEALQDFDIALRMRPGLTDIEYFRAKVRHHLGDYPGSVSDLKAVSAAYSREGEWNYYMGHNLLAMDDPGAAAPYLDKALKPYYLVRHEKIEVREETAWAEPEEKPALELLDPGYYDSSLKKVYPSGIGVQIASFSSPDKVEEIVSRYREDFGYPVFILVSRENELSLFKISIGNFSQREQALELRSLLRDEGFLDSFVVSYP